MLQYLKVPFIFLVKKNTSIIDSSYFIKQIQNSTEKKIKIIQQELQLKCYCTFFHFFYIETPFCNLPSSTSIFSNLL